jgi:3'-phosphoadenosine 5'-phosphosulfate sulfotransferase (PAPS reductase)/FAD synthetase
MLDDKITESHAILSDALREHLGSRDLRAVCVLFSGGNDSTTLTHLFRNVATHAVHANTTIGVERTRQFVRDCCAKWNLPLIEREPPESYRQLVLAHGFPGPAMHYKMYQRLKERSLRIVRRELVTEPRRQRVIFIAGRRRQESARRSSIPTFEVEGSIIWVSPLVDWSKTDLDEYRGRFNVPRNPVADELGMSGECECGAFAEPGEFERLARVDPECAAEIVELEHDALALGHLPEHKCRWGWGAYRDDPSAQPIKSGPLCSSCDARWENPERRLQELFASPVLLDS